MIVDTNMCDLFTSGICNLNCTYCYIPKNKDFSKKIQRKIFDDIESGVMIEKIKNTFDKNKLNRIAHWGAEPTLSLPKFKKFYEEIVDYFPNFNNIYMSSNFMTSPTIISDFIKSFPKNKPIAFIIQCSLDGPNWLTHINRRKSNEEKIRTNFLKFMKSIEDEKFHKIFVLIKSTISKYGIHILENKDKLFEYYSYFDDIFREVKSNNKNIEVWNECGPTVMLPGNYTKEDGESYSKIVEHQFEFRNKNLFNHVNTLNLYYTTLYRERYRTKFYLFHPQQVHCGAGHNVFAIGLDNKLHLCHRTFFEGEDDLTTYMNFSSECIDPKNFKSGRVNLVQNKYIADMSNDIDVSRLNYLGKIFQNFSFHRFNFSVNIIKEMALAGELSSCYKNKEAAASLFIICAAYHCPMEGVLNFGSMSINHHGFFKLLGNGACEQFLKNL